LLTALLAAPFRSRFYRLGSAEQQRSPTQELYRSKHESEAR
jgi:hypothetical protein